MKSQNMNLQRYLALILIATVTIFLAVIIISNDVFMKRSILKKPRIYIPAPPLKSKSGYIIGAIAGVAVALVLAFFALPAFLAGIGLTEIGVTSGSLAAIWQSYLGGAIASGSTFSVLQSISMGGISAGTYSFLTIIGLLSGSQLGTVLIGEQELTVDPKLIEELFDAHDLDEDDSITNSELKEVVRRLEPKMLEDLDSRYLKATNRTQSYYGWIKFSEYVKLFNLKVFEGDELKKMLEGVFIEKRQERGNVSCKDVKKMLPHLRVTASEEKIQDACYYVTDGELDNPFSFFQFLRIFGL